MMSDKLKDNRLRANQSSSLGAYGEAIAAKYLEKRGYALVAANFKTPVGRNMNGAQVTGEIDLIALDGDVLCFIEVKTRTPASAAIATPLKAVDLQKQRQITRTARYYKRLFKITGIESRYDVVSIVKEKDDRPKIEHFKGFWTEAKFKKKYRDVRY